MSTLLLDTDACIEIIRGNPGPLDAHPDAHPVLSVITRFEILSGLRQRASSKREQRALAFLDTAETLAFGPDAAAHAAAIRIALEKAGTPLGAYDLLIAGHARSEDIPLVTRNEKEFARVPDLDVRSW